MSKPSTNIILRILFHSVLLICLTQITGENSLAYAYEKFGYNGLSDALGGNLASNSPAWIVAYVLSLVFLKSPYIIRLLALILLYFLIVHFLLS